MHFSLPVVYNNRRELIAELKAQQAQPTRSYIVTIDGSGAQNVLSLNKKDILRSFVSQARDLPLSQLDIICSLEGNKILIGLLPKNTEQPNAEHDNTTNKKAGYTENLASSAEIEAAIKKQKQTQAQPATVNNQTLGTVYDEFRVYSTETVNAVIIDITTDNFNPQRPFEQDELLIEIAYQWQQQSFLYRSKIILAHAATSLNLALDFGSESSQMAVQTFEQAANVFRSKIKSVNLFDLVKAYHSNNGLFSSYAQEPTPPFYQEERDENYLKSIFYMRRNLSGTYKSLATEPFILEQAHNLRLITSKRNAQADMQQDFVQLINPKISQKHAEILNRFRFELNLLRSAAELTTAKVPVNLEQLQNKVTANILRVLIAAYLDNDCLHFPEQYRNIRMTLLVPNLYDSLHIETMQQTLNTILENLKEQEQFKDKIKNWEIVTLSESDAAFVGYLKKENHGVKNNAEYVIIDIGKGTTDFSVVRTGRDRLNDLQPIYRNGFAGAGNLITHAIFDNIIHFIREHSPNTGATLAFIRKQILQKLDSDNLTFKNDFFNEIERLKFNFHEDSPQAIKREWASAQTADFNWQNIVSKEASVDDTTIVNLLKQMAYGGDPYKYVDAACKTIAQKIAMYLGVVATHKEGFNCQGVILTGRGFLFKPLLSIVSEQIQKTLEISPEQIHMLQGSELKEVCIKGVFDATAKINAEKVGYPIQVYKKDNQGSSANTSKTVTNISDLLKPLYNFLFGSIDAEVKNLAVNFVDDTGIDLTQLDNGSILIGAGVYQANYFNIDAYGGSNVTADIEYSREGYKMRILDAQKSCQAVVALTEKLQYIDNDKKLVIPSLFPNYIMEDYIPSMKATVTPLANTATQSTNTSGINSDLLF